MIDIEKLIDKLLEKEIVDKLTIEVMGILSDYIKNHEKEFSNYEKEIITKWMEENNANTRTKTNQTNNDLVW